MKCPNCGCSDDHVLDSRQNNSGTSIRRRRECNRCSFRFTSYERIEEVVLKVVKRDQSRETFDTGKIERGVVRAIEKRPIPHQTVAAMLDSIEDEAMIKSRNNREIGSEEIGNMVLERLLKIDRVAYIRFASVYKKFNDVDEFMEEIRGTLTVDAGNGGGRYAEGAE